MEKTFIPKASEVSQEWILVDANDQNLGRLATQIATLLLGKHKPSYTPGMEMGDYVVVVNAGQITVTGAKLEDKKYYRHSMYPGGLKTINLRRQLAAHPDRVIRSAVWGMLPHNAYGRKLIRKLRIYAGPEHPHSAQNPRPLA